ncbi:putative 6-oxopurine nucleoside phosphorylase [Candidatus Hydrogenisulfobacillus filiaventi]|uniref:Probable 6-oxopurine nucleoside phosphorylase n=1 Tax=Candidatus Hydrogenisulfobacillus filiaventi TaxID=2707344 RepID=A0A6F8ZFM5_9FIRM|nr:S-methyl-5'-thioadenosine phosphorylase [Bacillota bacterium]CAB1128734.1 putative 6-oxopurine nucleoside phosphorylase [Candidatus Hydrogenisulfobacillus filiaventi]
MHSPTRRTAVGIIGGTGVYDPRWLEGAREETVTTPFGAVTLTAGRMGEQVVYFLNRHGPGHAVPPHRVNYRANLWALRAAGVTRVIATAAVGAVNRAMTPGSLVLCDSFLDFTHGRVPTFFEGQAADPALPDRFRQVVHTDMTEPYCPDLRARLAAAGRSTGAPVVEAGTYVATEGPRFESRAEIAAFARLGGDVVGMTGVPEVVLARELGMCYATVALVTNYAAGISPAPLTHAEVLEVMARHQERLRAVLGQVLPEAGLERRCACATTDPGWEEDPA